jgi:hypothetical protein
MRKFVDGVRVVDSVIDNAEESKDETTVSRSVQTSKGVQTLKTSDCTYKVEDIDDEATEFDPYA